MVISRRLHSAGTYGILIGMAEQKTRKKGIARGKRRAVKRMHYYEIIYPLRKLRRIWYNSGRITDLRKWADNYKTPTGVSGAGALVRLSKELKFAL